MFDGKIANFVAWCPVLPGWLCWLNHNMCWSKLHICCPNFSFFLGKSQVVLVLFRLVQISIPLVLIQIPFFFGTSPLLQLKPLCCWLKSSCLLVEITSWVNPHVFLGKIVIFCSNHQFGLGQLLVASHQLPSWHPTRICLVSDPWTPENDLLTAAMKLKRPIIADKHKQPGAVKCHCR